MFHTYEFGIGPDLLGATRNLLRDEGYTYFQTERFEIVAARRVETDVTVQIEGYEGQLWERWRFELLVHAGYEEPRRPIP